MWDSAFARFWWILRRGLAHYRLDKSLRPRLENPQNHRKILESYGDDSLRGLQSKGFSSQSLESCGVGGFGLQSSLESCAKLPPNLRKILESCGGCVARESVIASGVSRVAIHNKKQGVCNE